MEPTEGFWGGVGQAVSASPGWMVVGGILAIGLLYITARYIVPAVKEVKMRRLDIEQRQADTDAERVRANQALAEQQRQTNLLVDGMRQSLDASSARIDVIVTEIHGSRDGSRKMGGVIDRVDVTTQHTDTLVEDIHRRIVGGDKDA